MDREIDATQELFRGRTVDTLYLGGGTPTSLNADQLSRLFSLLERRLVLADGAEVTVEVNPATATPDRMSLLRRRGAVRASIGVQSFSDDVLSSLERVHSAGDARSAVVCARDAGFESIGLDLIYGVPRQTREDWRRTIEVALQLAPDHLSAYCLSADSGSRLEEDVRSRTAALPDDETVLCMYQDMVEMAVGAGFEQYELSNFALPGFACRHNINYWERGEYVGLGPGACSFVGNRRTRNVPDVDEYCSRLLRGDAAVDFAEELTSEQASLEVLYLGLRMSAGIELARYGDQFGSAKKEQLLARVRRHSALGLFTVENGRLRLTRRGMDLADEAVAYVAEP